MPYWLLQHCFANSIGVARKRLAGSPNRKSLAVTRSRVAKPLGIESLNKKSLIGRDPKTFAHSTDFEEAFSKIEYGAQLDVTLDDSAEYVLIYHYYMPAIIRKCVRTCWNECVVFYIS